MDKIIYRSAQTGIEAECEAILRTVPQWFGREGALRDYVDKISELDTYTARKGSQLIGLYQCITITRYR